jgi:predicted ATP-grasp superfamily ATP-dependent carboligase
VKKKTCLDVERQQLISVRNPGAALELNRYRAKLLYGADLSSGKQIFSTLQDFEETHLPVNLLVNSTNLRNSTLITGFHGVGETGYISVSFLVHALKANRIGFVDVAHPPPFVATSDSGLVTPFEVYKAGKIVLVKLEFSPHRTEEAEFAKTLAHWAMKNKFKDAVLIGGLDGSLKSGPDGVRVVPTKSYPLESMKMKHPTLEEGLFVYGPLAVMLAEFEKQSFPALAVLPYASANHADPKAAATAIESIAKAYHLKVDVKDLEYDAKDIEEEIDKRLEETSRSLRGMYG